MKKLAAVLIAMMVCSAAHAGIVTATGLVTYTLPGSQFHVGDQLRINMSYNPVTRYVTHTTIIDYTAGRVFNYGADGSRFFADTDPCNFSIFIQTVNAINFSMTLQAIAQNCVIPPLEQFNLNDFVIQFHTYGEFTSYPRITP